ncbi:MULTISPECIES: (2Fe-2S)-binding protein [unclassified Bradyrhizobium]|uniref:(2Fe-2S)-binding protein n=1 Tax=unclassified Bradyrhizobium TaxID=2631580 RepID=UPI0023051340|nr:MULTISPECIES: (2Fe-2S)-binding protein [unclassified Bradyrhizobium]MDA9451227.1 hypothetical protein [Bradyrhizobium sp. CCBAU 21360]MDA9457606.1 hypothetical protein [Bradyrhizobium sp. CCBAU 21359]
MRTATITFKLNGEDRTCETDARSLLVETVRQLEAKGTRIGCLTGDCGACTMIMDGAPIKSCLTLSVAAVGASLVTIEGLSTDLSEAVKSAFVARNGFQCGFCTSGMVIVATDFLQRNQQPSEQEIRDAIAGNLCRCTGYDDIVAAIGDAARALQEQRAEKPRA